MQCVRRTAARGWGYGGAGVRLVRRSDRDGSRRGHIKHGRDRPWALAGAFFRAALMSVAGRRCPLSSSFSASSLRPLSLRPRCVRVLSASSLRPQSAPYLLPLSHHLASVDVLPLCAIHASACPAPSSCVSSRHRVFLLSFRSTFLGPCPTAPLRLPFHACSPRGVISLGCLALGVRSVRSLPPPSRSLSESACRWSAGCVRFQCHRFGAAGARVLRESAPG